MDYRYDAARGITKERPQSNLVWNDMESTFILPVASTNRLSCLRIAMLQGQDRSTSLDDGSKIFCEAALDICDLFETPCSMLDEWRDAHVTLVAPHRAAAAVRPNESVHTESEGLATGIKGRQTKSFCDAWGLLSPI